ncbi:MAG: MarR family winged helix-turn-helix transcriptional regulator [Vicinamibacterales bacterium]
MPAGSSPARSAAVADALHSASIHLLRRVREVDDEAGLGPARLSALSVLVFGGPRRLTDLARAEQVQPPTMTKIVSGLEASGLARRAADPGDARAIRVDATVRGRRLLVDGRRRRVARLREGLATLLPEELDVLAHAAALMERVAGRLADVPVVLPPRAGAAVSGARPAEAPARRSRRPRSTRR